MTDLHIPGALAALYDHSGPFATVYLDASRAGESGAREIELRAESMCTALAEAGADDATVAAVGAAAVEPDGVPGRHGRVLVAAHGKVLLDSTLPRPPRREAADWSPLPHLLPLLAQAEPPIAHVVVTAHHTGAEITTAAARGPSLEGAAAAAVDSTRADGPRQHPMHLTGRDQWDERHFQNRVHDGWAENARAVAAEVRRHADDVHAELVVLGGDPHAVGLLRTELASALAPTTVVRTVDSDTSTARDGSTPEVVHDQVLRAWWGVRREGLEHVRQNLGRRRYAAAGLGDVTAALRRAQVDTVVLSDDPTSTATAWIGPEPLDLALRRDELTGTGVEQPTEVHYDDALVRAVVGGGAQLLITPHAHDYVDDGIAAILRF